MFWKCFKVIFRKDKGSYHVPTSVNGLIVEWDIGTSKPLVLDLTCNRKWAF